ncbi:MAG: endonuclease III domain-containing protein [candidate division WOR-3 bacterium]
MADSRRNRPFSVIFDDIFQRLYQTFGSQHWWPAETPFEVMVGAVLTQNTAWDNVVKALKGLKERRLLTPEALARLRPATLGRHIRPCGYYNVKARRLLELVHWLKSRGGIEAVRRLPTARLRQELLALKGIGPETADSILLYALNRPVFVVDAYTRRILSRHNLINGDEPYEQIRALFEDNLPRRVRLFNEFHALLVKLAKSHCRSRPLCNGCPLKPIRAHRPTGLTF